MSPPPPLELLYAICAPVVAEYIDELLAGQLKYDAPPASGQPSGETGTGEAAEYADPALRTCNPVLPLLQASVRVRHATLMVLSDALGIALDKSGVGRLTAKPWTHLHPIRRRLWAARHATFTPSTPLAVCPPLAAASPFLQTYERVAFAVEGFRHLGAHLARVNIPGVSGTVLSPMERRQALDAFLASFPFMQMMHHMCRYKPVVRQEVFRELAYGRLFVAVLLAGYGFIVCERVQYSLDWLIGMPKAYVMSTLEYEYDTCVDLLRWIDTLDSWYDGVRFSGNRNLLTTEDFFDFEKMLSDLSSPPAVDPDDEQVYTPVIVRVRAVMHQRKKDIQSYMVKIKVLVDEHEQVST